MKLNSIPFNKATVLLTNLSKHLVSTLVLSGLWAATPAARAGSLTWKYHYDSARDGYDKGVVGPTSRFEHLGTAYAQDGNKSYIVIYSNVDSNGVVYGQKQVRVFTGDLVLDFTGEGNLNEANGLPNLYTIKINNNNESSLQQGQIGVGSTLRSVYQTNYGFPTYQQYYKKLQRARTVDGRFAAPYMSDDPLLNTQYFGRNDPTLSVTDRSQSTIENAVRIISDPSEIQRLGVSLNLPGTTSSNLAQITVIEIDNSQLPSQEFIASLLTECGNDSFAFKAAIVPVVTTPPTSETPPATDTPPVTTDIPATPYSISFVGLPEAGGVSTGLIAGGSAAVAAILLLALLGGEDSTTGLASNPTPIPGGGGNGGGGIGGGGNNGGGGNGGNSTREVTEYSSPIALAAMGLIVFARRRKQEC